MGEQELTPELAAGLFGRRPEPEAGTAPTEQTGEAEQEPSIEQPQGSRDELSDDQLELVARYGLTAAEVKRVRGRSWAEKCQDAERLAAIVQQQPNRGELMALEANKRDQHQRIVDLFHPPPKSKGGEDS